MVLSSGLRSKDQRVRIGGAGGIGQPMSMLMAMNPLVKEVSP